MSAERVERRLAATLAADVAGYSRLIGKGEASALARLRSHRRELIDSKIAEHKGRIVKTTGWPRRSSLRSLEFVGWPEPLCSVSTANFAAGVKTRRPIGARELTAVGGHCRSLRTTRSYLPVPQRRSGISTRTSEQ